MTPLGNAWLRDQFHLESIALSKECRLGARPKSLPGGGSIAWEYFTKAYLPAPVPLEHVEFALKYDDLNLELLKAIFLRLPVAEVAGWVAGQPTGKWARRIGYLYEFLTGQDLDPKALGVGGNYAPLLDADRYVVAASAKKIPPWRIEDNLLGTRNYCPVVRKTRGVEAGLGLDVASRLNALKDRYSPEIFRRAVGYFYQKETRSSYGIEREEPTPDREARFVAALHDAGKAERAGVFSQDRLVTLQNIIVDPRYAQSAYRTDQNYVGETLPNYQQRIHYVPPPPQFVQSLMEGLGELLLKAEGTHALVRAAVAAFGFVFVHPFEDGNGRLHRFLIHDILALDGFVPAGVILPVSAWMLKDMGGYDACLEGFSAPLMARVRYGLDEEDQMTVLNPDEIEAIYRYPDMTVQVEYLARAIEGALAKELEPELDFLAGYDKARQGMRSIVDMPDRKLDTFLKLLHQNHGLLSKAKRDLFKEVSDAELARLEAVYAECFGGEAGHQALN